MLGGSLGEEEVHPAYPFVVKRMCIAHQRSWPKEYGFVNRPLLAIIVWARKRGKRGVANGVAKVQPILSDGKESFFSFFVLETKTFLSAFESGLDELDMDVY